MEPERLEQSLADGCLLLVDTSVIPTNQLIGLSNLVSRWNSEHRTTVRVAVGSLVYTERQAQERRKRPADFDAQVVREFLAGKQIEVLPHDHDVAEAASEWLFTIAPTDQDWKRLKHQRLTKEVRDVPPRTSATVDWFIGGHTVARGAILVTNDKGAEFRDVDDKVGLDELTEHLKAHLADVTS